MLLAVRRAAGNRPWSVVSSVLVLPHGLCSGCWKPSNMWPVTAANASRSLPWLCRLLSFVAKALPEAEAIMVLLKGADTLLARLGGLTLLLLRSPRPRKRPGPWRPRQQLTRRQLRRPRRRTRSQPVKPLHLRLLSPHGILAQPVGSQQRPLLIP